MPTIAVIMPRDLTPGDVAKLEAEGLTVRDPLPLEGHGVRVVVADAADNKAAMEQVLGCLGLSTWEVDGIDFQSLEWVDRERERLRRQVDPG